MDPITALAAATAIWSGIKATVDAGREVQDVFGQLGAWAEQANKVYEVINHKEGKASIFSICFLNVRRFCFPFFPIPSNSLLYNCNCSNCFCNSATGKP